MKDVVSQTVSVMTGTPKIKKINAMLNSSVFHSVLQSTSSEMLHFLVVENNLYVSQTAGAKFRTCQVFLITFGTLRGIFLCLCSITDTSLDNKPQKTALFTSSG